MRLPTFLKRLRHSKGKGSLSHIHCFQIMINTLLLNKGHGIKWYLLSCRVIVAPSTVTLA